MSDRRRWMVALAVLVVVALAAACGGGDDGEAQPRAPESSPAASDVSPTAAPTDTPSPAATATPVPEASQPDEEDGDLAPELAGISGWINAEPFTLEGLRGNVVLVDFWTYTCINCIRTFPYLRSWHDKYADAGLVIVGVHTPEFEFEELHENVVEAVGKFGIEYPVVQDNDYDTWGAFENRYWPAKYLIDKEGRIQYTHFGEGAYDETEGRIRDLLVEAGYDVSGISPGTEPDAEIDSGAITSDPDMSLTRELYAGHERNYALYSRLQPPYVLHEEYYDRRDADIFYTDPGLRRNHFIYLQGLWRNKAESLVHARETEDNEDYIVINFSATSVNAVMAPEAAGSYAVLLTIDGAPLGMDQVGPDVMFDQEGNSYVLVDGARMYNLVNLASFGSHELKLSSDSPQFVLFAFTFGAYMGGEPGS